MHSDFSVFRERLQEACRVRNLTRDKLCSRVSLGGVRDELTDTAPPRRDSSLQEKRNSNAKVEFAGEATKTSAPPIAIFEGGKPNQGKRNS